MGELKFPDRYRTDLMINANSKPITARLKLRVVGGQASAAPPVGSTLGQYGVNMMDFIKPFNDATQTRVGEKLTVHIFIHNDRTMTWRIVGQATDELILQALGVDKGSGKPNLEKLPTKLTDQQLTAIAQQKLADTNSQDLVAVKKIVAGTARSMGVEIEA